MSERQSAYVYFTPRHEGDGYSWGGDAILTVGNTAVNFGTYGEVAEEVAGALNSHDALVDALSRLLGIIDAAGLDNLSNGVQLGPTVWYVKACDAVNEARAALLDPDRPIGTRE